MFSKAAPSPARRRKGADKMETVKIVIEDTPEKFRPMAEVLVPPLVELLRQRNELEREICARSLKLREEQAAAGISPHLSTPAEESLWEEYRRRYLELVTPRCTEKLLRWGAAGSFGRPAKYDYLFEAPEPAVYFTMKSAKKALMSTRNPVSHDYRYCFTLRLFGDEWKIDGAECAFGGREEWSVEHTV